MAMRVLTFLALLALSACGGSNQAAGESPSPTAPAQLTPSASANLDPCQLVTQQEASQLAGTTYAAGKRESISSASSICTYGAQTLNVFTVEVAVASDATTAQADWAQEEAKAQAGLQQLVAEAGGSVSLNAGDISLPGADKAATAIATANISGQTLNISAIYVLKGAVFFTFADLVAGKQAPTASAMAAQAQTVLTRV
jgi:D-arabinose 1-dehydrogenase-like Zn-dependent alcohol dehydrogenase